MLQSLIDLACDTGFLYVDWRMIVMWGVVAVLMYLAVFREFEPLLLVPIAFGALLANLPTEGVLNKPAGAKSVSDTVKGAGATQAEAQKDVEKYFKFLEDVTGPASREDTLKKAKGIPDLVAIVRPDTAQSDTDKEAAEASMAFKVAFKGKLLDLRGSDLLVFAQASGDVTDVMVKAGERVANGQKLVDVYSARTPRNMSGGKISSKTPICM